MRKELKRRTDCPQENAKKLLKQRLDFPFDERIETMDGLRTVQGQKMLKKRLDFPFEKTIKTTDTLPTMQGKQSVETTIRLSISHKN